MMALAAYKKGNSQEALAHVRAAGEPPSSLGIDDYATVKSARLLTFEALLHEAAGHVAEARSVWETAARTRDDDIEGEGLFRAIALLKIGQTQEANEWLAAFPPVNAQRRTDNSIEVRTGGAIGAVYPSRARIFNPAARGRTRIDRQVPSRRWLVGV